MIGKIRIKVGNQRNSYDFTLKRNITILRGNSGTGKTTLYDMVRDYNNLGKESGVKISGGKIAVLEGKNWERELDNLEKTVVVIDEGSKFISSPEFAKKIDACDNYFLLITRNYLEQLPYSVDEIYRIKGRGKNKSLEKIYLDRDRFYDNPNLKRFPFHPDLIITEDSNSGNQFFKNAVKDMGIECIPAGGKSGIKKLLEEYKDLNIIVVADGAAIGPEMESLVKAQELSYGKLALFLPESFEWLILKSGVIGEIEELNETYNYVDSTKYKSWEQYFTHLLVELSKNDKAKKYNKSRLPKYYIQPIVKEKILNQIPHLKLEP